MMVNIAMRVYGCRSFYAKNHLWLLRFAPGRMVLSLWCCFMALAASAEEITPPAVLHGFFDERIDIAAGVLLLKVGDAFLAHDVETGQVLWQRLAIQNQMRQRVSSTSRGLVFSHEAGFFVVDWRDGRERWRHSELGQGKLEHAGYVTADSEWIAANYEKSVYVYDGARRSHRIPLSLETYESVYPAGILPDGRIILAAKQKEKASIITLYYWTLQSDELIATRTLHASGAQWVQLIPNSHSLLRLEYDRSRPSAPVYSLVDLDTGAMQVLEKASWWMTPEGNTLVSEPDTNRIELISLKSGDILARIEDPGHVFSMTGYSRAFGKDWLISSMDRGIYRSYWLWPVETNAVPHRLLDGQEFSVLPGHIHALSPPYAVFRTGRRLAAYRLKDMSLVSEWKVMSGHYPHFGVNADTKYALAYSYGMDAPENQEEQTTHVYASGRETPLFSVKGRPVALSPDGRHVLVQKAEDRSMELYEVDSGEMRAAFAGNYAMQDCFAPNSSRLLVYQERTPVIVDLEGAYSQRVLTLPDGISGAYGGEHAFSPDGRLLVMPGRGAAHVFDTETGNAVFHLEESVHVLNRHRSSSNNALSRMEDMARNVAGWFTNRAKERPWVEGSFSGDGSRIMTTVYGQTFSLWEARTGKRIRTTHTGLPEIRDREGYIHNRSAFSEDGLYALAYNASGLCDAMLWNIRTGRLIRQYALPPGRIFTAAVAEDGSVVYFVVEGSLYILPGNADKQSG